MDHRVTLGKLSKLDNLIPARSSGWLLSASEDGARPASGKRFATTLARAMADNSRHRRP
jgi:hypothetical protein